MSSQPGTILQPQQHTSVRVAQGYQEGKSPFANTAKLARKYASSETSTELPFSLGLQGIYPQGDITLNEGPHTDRHIPLYKAALNARSAMVLSKSAPVFKELTSGPDEAPKQISRQIRQHKAIQKVQSAIALSKSASVIQKPTSTPVEAPKQVLKKSASMISTSIETSKQMLKKSLSISSIHVKAPKHMLKESPSIISNPVEVPKQVRKKSASIISTEVSPSELALSTMQTQGSGISIISLDHLRPAPISKTGATDYDIHPALRAGPHFNPHDKVDDWMRQQHYGTNRLPGHGTVVAQPDYGSSGIRKEFVDMEKEKSTKVVKKVCVLEIYCFPEYGMITSGRLLKVLKRV